MVNGSEHRVRTFNARRGRRSVLTDARLLTLLPGYAVPPAVLAPPGAPGRPECVVLEVGCGHGAAALAYAAATPEAHIVALDVHPPGVARMVAAVDAAGLSNLSAELADAVEFLAERVPQGALDAVHLFFPDPWPKTRHHRRRFVSPDTLELLAMRLTPAGRVLVATDSPDYAAYVRVVVAAHGGFVVRDAARPTWRP
ncbi:MAG: methyltransferase domain-containing protein, partial [Candidatus Phosphoribacter sp.]